MPFEHVRQHLDPPRTPWHITFGTYGTRLHGDDRPTVDRQHNQRDTPFILSDPHRAEFERGRMRFQPRYLSLEQRAFAEEQLPTICLRGGWNHRVCSAGPDHVHLLCDVSSDVHGEKVRRLVKRWLGQALSDRWLLPKGATWWAEEGSNIAIDNEEYLNNCFICIRDQRTMPFEYAVSGPGTARLAEDSYSLVASRGVPAPDSSSTSYNTLPFYHFHVNLFAARPAAAFECTWEDAAVRLERLPRMIFEPDGSFVISGSVMRAGPSSAPADVDPRAERWQVDGHLFDFDGRMHRVELHGQCPPAALDDLLRCVGWPAQRLEFEMVREGVTLDEHEFRRTVGAGTARLAER